MAKPQPVLGQDPGNDPPSYSSIFGSQSQENPLLSPVPPPSTMPPNPVPPASARPPYPVQMPVPQDTAMHNFMSQARFDDGQPMTRPANNPTYAPTTYDSMANVPGTNQWEESTQAVILSSEQANSTRKAKKYRRFKICSTIGTILILIGIGIRLFRALQH